MLAGAVGFGIQTKILKNFELVSESPTSCSKKWQIN